jgi:predicted PurR-regulated permease PerM
MQIEDLKVSARSNPSQRIIAVAIIFAFLYFTSDVVVPLLLAVLIAYFLDPVVGTLERIHIPRALGSLVVMLAVTSLLAGLGYLVALRADQFLEDWPRYSQVLRHATTTPSRRRRKRGAPRRHGRRSRLRCASGCCAAWDRCTRF